MPFYTYDGEDGARRENIPLSTLVRFQNHYGDEAITKWDIFHYVYAVLHHPEYRTRYAANLRRELPRIPMVGLPQVGTSLRDVRDPLPREKLGRLPSAPVPRSAGNSPTCTFTTNKPPSIRSSASKPLVNH